MNVTAPRIEMLRKLTILPALLMVAGLSAQTPPKTQTAPPFQMDKPKVEAYLRHLFVWPSAIQMTLSDPVPSDVPGLYQFRMRAAQGEASQEEEFYISSDGQKIIRGTAFELAKNPFKEDLDKLKTEYQPNFGTPGAPVVLVEFSDFECPFCRQEAQVLRQNLLKTYPKEVRLYYMDFPLESLHPWAKAASIAGRCIFHQNASAFWDYHDWIFGHQEEITPDNLKSKVLEFASGKGLVADPLSSCIDSKATESEVDNTRQMGHALGVDQTPTLFVNGRRMVGVANFADLQRVIDYEIDYQKTAKNAGEDCGCEVKLPMPGASPQNSAPGTLHK
jgi:protein-disulfide isomerase